MVKQRFRHDRLSTPCSPGPRTAPIVSPPVSLTNILANVMANLNMRNLRVAETEKYRFPPGSDVWWDVAPAEATEDQATRELRSQYEKSRAALQRFYY